VTLQLAVLSTIAGAVLAFATGIGKLSGNKVIRWLSVVYIEVFRGTSLLVQLFWIYYALPLLGVRLDPVTAGVTALALNIGAYGAEVIRGALQSVAEGQKEAAVALNFSKRYTLWHVLLPQALPEMMPPFGNLVVQNLKNTALASLITLNDLTFAAQTLRNFNLRETVPIYTITLFLYFFLALGLTGLMRLLERAVNRRAGVSRREARAS
jgi:polar amino acid transport system permease protein